jgi:hypothetical protein
MKTFVTLPESFSRKGKTFVKTELTEKEALGIVRLTGKAYRRVKAKAEPKKIVFYLEDKTVSYAERIMWDTIKADCKLPESDNNDGFIYGLNLIEFEAEGDIIDVQWFKESDEREKFIEENNLIIVFD